MSFRGPTPPQTVCESDVQINARVFLTTASLGPGCGTGLSMNPTSPICFMTNAFTATPRAVPAEIRPPADRRGSYPAGQRGNRPQPQAPGGVAGPAVAPGGGWVSGQRRRGSPRWGRSMSVTDV